MSGLATLKAMGEEKGMAYMRELAKQTELRTGRNLIAQLVAAGEFKGALSATRKPSRL